MCCGIRGGIFRRRGGRCGGGRGWGYCRGRSRWGWWAGRESFGDERAGAGAEGAGDIAGGDLAGAADRSGVVWAVAAELESDRAGVSERSIDDVLGGPVVERVFGGAGAATGGGAAGEA